MEENKFNPKPLDLTGLESATSKVTLGFKIDPKEKLALAREAEDYCISLSQYVEEIVMGREQIINGSQESYEWQAKVEGLKNKLAFYENEMLNKLLKENIGQTVEYVNGKKEKVKIKIQSMQDVYTVALNSFHNTRP